MVPVIPERSVSCSAAVRRSLSTYRLHRLLRHARVSAGSAAVHGVHSVPRSCSDVVLESDSVYSSRTRVHIFKDSDSDSDAARVISGTTKFDRDLSRLLHTELHWLDVPERVAYGLCFKKIQWTFSIYFLNSNYLVSYSTSV